VATGYTDAGGRHRHVDPGTVAAVLDAMGASDGGPPGGDSPLMLRPPLAPPASGTGRLIAEDGAEAYLADVPADLAPGYYRLVADDRPERLVVVTPGRCPLPGGQQWGWSAQLYATRSARSWGLGDLGDLAELARWSSTLGARMLMINPLHASAPGPHPQASPYYPSSRCFRSPLYLRVEDVPGAAQAGIDDLGKAARALNQERIIDRSRVWELKGQALEAIFDKTAAGTNDDPGFRAFVAEQGQSLAHFAVWCALAERHGVPWQQWPAEYRHPLSPAVTAFSRSAEGRRRVRYHQWLQWHLDRQLGKVTDRVGVVQDLAIGVDPGGADAWMWQDTFADGMRVGAPPDQFNTRGQDWGLPPFDPWKLRAGGYRPFIETVRSGLRHAGGLRVDHVMGLFRLWWIPQGNSPADGAYVAYPSADLLDILTLEAHRAGAYVVGEDLGTVEPGVREELARRRMLSYRVLWFEDSRPPAWPEQALAAVSTHDLPTIAGAWTGSDLEVQRRLGLAPNEEGSRQMRRRLEGWTGHQAGAAVDDVVVDTYRLLSEAPCLLTAASLDDACGVEERPNLPGTTDERPNWSLALPLGLEDLKSDAVARRIADALNRRPS
jgi:4-alpha-glucanotransferase